MCEPSPGGVAAVIGPPGNPTESPADDCSRPRCSHTPRPAALLSIRWAAGFRRAYPADFTMSCARVSGESRRRRSLGAEHSGMLEAWPAGPAWPAGALDGSDADRSRGRANHRSSRAESGVEREGWCCQCRGPGPPPMEDIADVPAGRSHWRRSCSVAFEAVRPLVPWGTVRSSERAHEGSVDCGRVRRDNRIASTADRRSPRFAAGSVAPWKAASSVADGDGFAAPLPGSSSGGGLSGRSATHPRSALAVLPSTPA